MDLLNINFKFDDIEEAIKDYKETSFKECPFYIREVFKNLHKF